MKLYVTALLVIITCTIGSFAEKQPYWSLSAGWAQPGDAKASVSGIDVVDVEYDAGWVVEGAVGIKKPRHPLAYELAFSYQKNDLKVNTTDIVNQALGESFSVSGDVTIWTLMANGIYMVENESQLTPYGLIGIGILDYDGDDTVLAGQIGIGISYAIDKISDIKLGYRYLFAQDAEESSIEWEIDNHAVQLGYTRYY